MKLNKEKLCRAGFIGNWLSLLRYELCVLVWLVFFFTVFILYFDHNDVATPNVA